MRALRALESAPRDPPQPLAAVSWHDSKVMTVGLFGGHKQRKPERERGGESLEGDKFIS